MATRIENASAATKEAIRNLVEGEQILTVHPTHGRFATLADALTFIATQPTMVQVTTTAVINCVQHSHWCPRTSGLFNDARAGDFLYLTNDDPAVDVWQYDWHHYRILSAEDNTTEAMPGLILEHNIMGATQNGVTAVIYRPAKFTIQMLDGAFTTNNCTMPDGYEVTIRGIGRETVVAGSGIYMPIYGYTRFENFLQTFSLTRSDTRTQDVGNSLLDAGFDCIEMRDMWVEGQAATFMGNHCFQSTRIKNVECSGFKGHRFYLWTYMGDYCVVENCNYLAATSMEFAEVFRHPRRSQSSHRKIAKNCTFKREQDHSTILGGNHASLVKVHLEPVTTTEQATIFDWINCVFDDDDLQLQARNHGIFGFLNHSNPSVDLFMNFRNCKFYNSNSHTYEFVVEPSYAVNSRVHLTFDNTTEGDNNTQISDNFTTGTVVKHFYHPASYYSVPYAVGFVPDANTAEVVEFGPITGGVTVLNPTSPRRAQTLRLHFTQDATGSHVLNFAAATAMKVHTNPTGGANQKAVYEFYYDGTHWVQTNQPVWA